MHKAKARTDAAYHRAELEIALSASDPRHALPPRVDGRVLDIGCGAGQSLLALYPDRRTFGLDPDLGAMQIGRNMAGNVEFTCGIAEQLPYASDSFHHVFSRVALPYTNVSRSLREIHRVLKPGGTAWLLLHPYRMVWQSSTRPPSVRGLVYLMYVTVNGLLLHCCGRQVQFFGRMISFQTVGGMEASIRKAGLRLTSVETGAHFIVTAEKPCT